MSVLSGRESWNSNDDSSSSLDIDMNKNIFECIMSTVNLGEKYTSVALALSWLLTHNGQGIHYVINYIVSYSHIQRDKFLLISLYNMLKTEYALTIWKRMQVEHMKSLSPTASDRRGDLLLLICK